MRWRGQEQIDRDVRYELVDAVLDFAADAPLKELALVLCALVLERGCEFEKRSMRMMPIFSSFSEL